MTTLSDKRPIVAPVVMSGGSGTRLWPLSTPDKPKQFHGLNSDKSLLQETIQRVSTSEQVVFLPPIMICNAEHQAMVGSHLAEIGVAPSVLVLEPFGRNTAAVAAIAAELVSQMHPGALALLLPADHVVTDERAFHSAIETAADCAQDNIVTFGIRPARPETGYGYIKQGEPLARGVFRVAQFTEKPAQAVAESYLNEGCYAWNAGIFLFAPSVMLDEMEKSCAALKDAALHALAVGLREGGLIFLPPKEFRDCPSVPVDIAVMERTERAAVVPCDIGWADIGSWSELWRLGPAGPDGVSSHGQAISLDVTDSLLWSDGPLITALGVNDLIIVATGDAVLVLPKSRAQDVRALLDEMRRRG